MKATKKVWETIQSGYNLDCKNPDCKGLQSGISQIYQQIEAIPRLYLQSEIRFLQSGIRFLQSGKLTLQNNRLRLYRNFTIWILKFQIVKGFSQLIQHVECEIPDCNYNLKFQFYNLAFSPYKTTNYIDIPEPSARPIPTG